MNKFFKIFKIELYCLTYAFFYYLPGYYVSNKLRALYIKCFLKSCGKGLILNKEVTIEAPEKITIGDYCGFNSGCWISAGGELELGDYVIIGPKTVIHTANHNFEMHPNIPFAKQGHTFKKITIGNNVWIGAGCILLPGIAIGNNVIVGAGSIVTKNLDSNSVYAGNPAKKLKDIA